MFVEAGTTSRRVALDLFRFDIFGIDQMAGGFESAEVTIGGFEVRHAHSRPAPTGHTVRPHRTRHTTRRRRRRRLHRTL
eukprot:511970-Prymnesium_polylepis.1